MKTNSCKTTLGLFAILSLLGAGCSSERSASPLQSSAPRSAEEENAGELAPKVAAERDRASHAAVRLPLRADGAFRVSSARGEISASVRLQGAQPSVAEVQSDRVVYPGGLGEGADMEHRPSWRGTEDFVTFEARPADESLTYLVDVRRLAGLRLVPGTDTVEMLDAGGAPRLRMEPPYIVDATGKKTAAHVDVVGCHFDTDPRPPWGRQVVAPGREECSLRVTWSASPADYPVKVDPGWSTTGSSAAKRLGATATALADGRVLVIGGAEAPFLAPTELVEIYDPETGAWATTAPATGHPAQFQSATTLKTGDVLVVGGTLSFGGVGDTFLYNVASATWSMLPSTGSFLQYHAAALLTDGSVLVCENVACLHWDPASQVWSPWPGMQYQRQSFVLVPLADGRVLAAGGLEGEQVEVLTGGASGTWQLAGALSSARFSLASQTLTDGRVLLVGGATEQTVSAEVDIFDPAANGGKGGISPGPKLANARMALALVPLSGGFLAIGGYGGSGMKLASTEWLDSALVSWKEAAPLSIPRTQFPAAVLPADGVLVVGGEDSSSPVSVAERCNGMGCLLPCQTQLDCPPGQSCRLGACAAPAPTGYECTDPSACASGKCEQGVCCDTVCTGGCTSCNANDRDPGLPSGTCAAVSYGRDPKNACAPGSGMCAPEGVCDGLGSCSLGPKGNGCGLTCSDANLYFDECDGLGACKPAFISQSCSPYVACAGNDCPTSCKLSTECIPGYQCIGGVCAGTLGATCYQDSLCNSGHCAPGGVCCDKACTGGCETCVSPSMMGTCVLLPAGKSPTSFCNFSIPCGVGSCDGVSSECHFPGQQTPCAVSSCFDQSAMAVGTGCNGTGQCTTMAVPCEDGFACNFGTGSCRTSCASDYDCQDGCCYPKTHTCIGMRSQDTPGLCVDGTAQLTVAGFACQFHECLTTCSPGVPCDDGVLYCVDFSQCAPGDDCLNGTCNGTPSKLGAGGAGGQGGASGFGGGAGVGGAAGVGGSSAGMAGVGGNGGTGGTGGTGAAGAKGGAGGSAPGAAGISGSSAAGHGIGGVAAAGGASAGAAARHSGAGSTPSPSNDDSSGACGCRTERGGEGAPPLSAAPLLVLLALRRGRGARRSRSAA